MSGEKPATPTFDPLEEARANSDEQKTRYYNMVGEVSEFPDRDTFAAANKDMVDYLEARPYKDAKDNIHSAGDAKFMKKNETENQYHDRIAGASLEGTDQFEGKSVVALARMVAEARSRGDVTGATDAEDQVSQKLTEMAEKNGWSDEAFSAQVDRLDKIMNGEVSASQPTGVKSGEPKPSATPGSGPAKGPEGGPAAPDQPPVGGPEAASKPVPEQGRGAQASKPEAVLQTSDLNTILDNLRASDRYKNASPEDQKTMKDEAANRWIASEAAKAKQTEKTTTDQPESDLNVILKNLEETDAYKNASPEDQQRMKDEAANRWIASEAAKAKQTEKTTTDQPESDLNVILKNLEETDAYKNASPEDQQRMKDEAANRWIAAEAAKAKLEKDSTDGALDAILEKTVPGYKDMSEAERKAVRDELRASGVLKDEKPEKADEVAEKLRKEKIEKIDVDMEKSPLSTTYQEALKKYAELKADNDTRSFPFGIGRKKHERLMDQAATALVNAKKALASETTARRLEAGAYEGDEAQMAKSRSNDIFDEIRKIDPDTRKMTTEELRERQKDRNVLQRTAVKFGRFLNRGDKAVGRYAKNAGVGLGIGLVKGGALGLFGATWPVGVPVAGVINTVVLTASRYGAKMNILDETLKTHMDENGNAIPELNDEQFKKRLESSIGSIPENIRDDGKISDALAREILSGARQAGVDEKKAAQLKANKNVAAMGIGMALGGVIGGFSGKAIHEAWTSAHTPTPTAGINPAPNPNDMPAHVEAPATVEAPVPVPTGHFDLNNAKFPWDYAAQHSGANNAMAELQAHAKDAVARGHKVAWYITKNGSRALRVDGNDTTQYVVDVLWGNN